EIGEQAAIAEERTAEPEGSPQQAVLDCNGDGSGGQCAAEEVDLRAGVIFGVPGLRGHVGGQVNRRDTGCGPGGHRDAPGGICPQPVSPGLRPIANWHRDPDQTWTAAVLSVPLADGDHERRDQQVVDTDARGLEPGRLSQAVPRELADAVAIPGGGRTLLW